MWLRLPLEMIEMVCREARIQQHCAEMIRGLQLLTRLTGVDCGAEEPCDGFEIATVKDTV